MPTSTTTCLFKSPTPTAPTTTATTQPADFYSFLRQDILRSIKTTMKGEHIGDEPFQLSARDIEQLKVDDEDFERHDWAFLKDVIARNDLGILMRIPSDLRAYRQWTANIKARYGSIPDYICQERLHWTPLNESGSASNDPIFAFNNATPFADPADFKILRNDWPYGVSDGITHLVVWLKNRMDVDWSRDGDLTDASRALVENYVKKTFTDRVRAAGFEDAEDRVMWFKNWAALQSVRGMDHIHILLRDVPEDLIVEWSGEKSVKR